MPPPQDHLRYAGMPKMQNINHNSFDPLFHHYSVSTTAPFFSSQVGGAQLEEPVLLGRRRDGQPQLRMPPVLPPNAPKLHVQLRRQHQHAVARGLRPAAGLEPTARPAAAVRGHGREQRGRSAYSGTAHMQDCCTQG